MFRSSSLPRRALACLRPTVVTAGILLSVATGVTAQESATPTPIGLVQEAENLAECAPAEIGALPEGVDAATVYAIVPEESAARYRVQEELAQVGETEAVGETQAIIGQFGFAEDGLPLPCSRFDVDLRTLQSDQAKRDNYLYQNTLEAERYPLATFVLRAIEGLEAPLEEGQETTLRLIGDLTLRDVTKLVAWEAKVALDRRRVDRYGGDDVRDARICDRAAERTRGALAGRNDPARSGSDGAAGVGGGGVATLRG